MDVRTQIRAAPAVVPTAGVAAVAAAGVAFVLVAYAASPKVAIVLFVGAGVLTAVLARPMLGVYLGILAAPLDTASVSLGSFGGLSAAEAVFVAAGLSTIVQELIVRRLHGPLDPAHAAFAALLVVAATGIAFATDPYVVAKTVVMWTVFLVLSLLVASARPAARRRVMIVIAISGAILGAMAIPSAGRIQLLGGGEVAANRAAASFSSPNILAFFLLLALGPSLALALRSRAGTRLIMTAATVLVAVGLVLTLSRGAIIGAACSIAIMLASPAFRRAMAVLLVLLAIGLVVDGGRIVESHEVSVVRTRLSTIAEETSTNPRLQIYRAAPTIVADHPIFGIGEGNFPSISAQYGLRDIGGDVFQHAHNLPLTIAIETGLVGLAVFVGFIVAMGRVVLRVLRAPPSDEKSIGIGIAAALIGLLVTSMTDYPLRANVVMAVIMVEVGALVAYARAAGERPR